MLHSVMHRLITFDAFVFVIYLFAIHKIIRFFLIQASIGRGTGGGGNE